MIQIDFREKDILKYCNEQLNGRNIEIKTDNLLLGDIQIDKLLFYYILSLCFLLPMHSLAAT